jgi:D-alanyl-D-alanine carboxypeptidase
VTACVEEQAMGSEEDESGGRDGFRFTRRQVIGAGAAGAATLMAGQMDPAAAADGCHSSRWWQGGGQFSGETQRALTSILVSGMGAANIPGLEVGIWVPGQGNLVEALGTSDHLNGTSLSTSGHFRIASITKSFVATAVLQLVDSAPTRTQHHYRYVRR